MKKEIKDEIVKEVRKENEKIRKEMKRNENWERKIKSGLWHQNI
jgi:hypothetical protein